MGKLLQKRSELRLVGDIRYDKDKLLRKVWGLYRWWFPMDSKLVGYIQKNYPGHENGKSLEELLPRIKIREIEGKEYVALYVGKSDNIYHRFHQHIAGNTHTSTIRHTITGLCYAGIPEEKSKQELNEMLDQCYFEWTDFPEDKELVDIIESLVITSGCYPLNIDGNFAICDEWRKQLLEARSRSNRSN